MYKHSKIRYENNIDKILDNEIGKLLDRNRGPGNPRDQGNQGREKSYNPSKEILVLSGGSIRGVAQLGALHCLKKHNMLDNIRTIAATSAGSAIGMLYCAGYQPMEF